MNRYLDAFDDYNPLVETYPEALAFDVGYIHQQAKLLLPGDATVNDLNAGLEILFQLRKHIELGILEFQAKCQNDELEKSLFTTSAYARYLCSDLIEPGHRSDGTPFTWSTLFAISALASVSDYIALSEPTPCLDDPAEGKTLSELIRQYREDNKKQLNRNLLIEAMDSLGFARVFQERETAPDSDRKRGQGVSKRKLANYHDIKLAVVVGYNQLPSTLSDRKAAKAIYNDLTETLQAKFVNDDPIQQIQKWLSQYRKGTLAGQEALPACLKHT